MSQIFAFKSRLPTLITSLIYLILNSYSIALLVVWLDSLESDTTSPDYDPSDQSTLIVFIGTALRSWCALSASVAACGSLGAFINSLPLLRIFAFGSTLDLFLNFFIFLTTVLLTLSPTLSAPFSDLICNTLTRGELFSVTALMREKESRATGWGLKGVDVIAFGVESCEENWRAGVAIVLAGLLLGIMIRIYGVSCVWEYYTLLERDSMGEAGDWFDLRNVEKETITSRIRHSGRLGRSKTTPQGARGARSPRQGDLPLHRSTSLLTTSTPSLYHSQRIRHTPLPTIPSSIPTSVILEMSSSEESTPITTIIPPLSPTRTGRASETEDDYPTSRANISSLRRVRANSRAMS